VAWVDGFYRRFWQGSHDHRGTPDAPGRVVTLIPSPGGRCGGMAYEIAATEVEHIFSKLDYREKNGYQRHQVSMLFTDGSSVEGVLYVADRDNEAFLGGPSGSNEDYLRNLACALREHGIEDDHVFLIESQLNRLAG